ncbi:hypothetical protein MJO29_014981 [Puccinia striiformis f. sp. tritici]|nr:hypothetical protein MJO29_014981 [Puccinia striiformis f. sp. tritici]
MTKLSKKLFACLALRALCVSRLALSSLDADQHAVRESMTKIKSLRLGSERILLRIEMLDAQRNPELQRIKSQLQELYRGLKTSILERVRRLSGLGPSLATVQFKVETGSRERDVVSSLEPIAAQITSDKHWINAGNGGNSGLSRSVASLHLDSDIESKGLNPDPIETLAGKSVKDRGEDSRYEFPGDIIGVLKEHMLHREMKTWSSLQATLIRLQAQNYLVETDARFLLGFLKIVYLLGDLIHEYRLMPSNFINNMEIFNPNTLSKMVRYQIDILFSQWQGKFFDVPGSLMPQLEFLMTGRAVRHFHRSIKALGPEDQRDLVYVTLTTIMRNAARGYPGSSQAFSAIYQEFTRNGFTEEMNGISSAMIKAEPGRDPLGERRNFPIVHMIQSAINLFRNPSDVVGGKTERIEFQLVYYIIDFLDQYYHPIMRAMAPEIKNHSALFPTQLEFMHSYINFFRHRLEEERYHLRPENNNFRIIAHRAIREDALLDDWILKVSNAKIQHNETPGGLMVINPNFDYWMGQHQNSRELWAENGIHNGVYLLSSDVGLMEF